MLIEKQRGRYFMSNSVLGSIVIRIFSLKDQQESRLSLKNLLWCCWSRRDQKPDFAKSDRANNLARERQRTCNSFYFMNQKLLQIRDVMGISFTDFNAQCTGLQPTSIVWCQANHNCSLCGWRKLLNWLISKLSF